MSEQRLGGNGVTEAVTVMPRAEYKINVSGAGSPRLTRILGPLNEFVVAAVTAACSVEKETTSNFF